MITLGALKAELKKSGIRQVGILRRTQSDKGGSTRVTIYFSADEKIVFPFKPKTIYPLVLKSDADDTPVNKEKVKALKRSLIAGWDEE